MNIIYSWNNYCILNALNAVLMTSDWYKDFLHVNARTYTKLLIGNY